MSIKPLLFFAIGSLGLLYACAEHPPQPDQAQLLAETRAVANTLPPGLMAVLQEEIARGGLAAAINVCREKAPAMAKAASAKTGWHIRRVSEKNRNPKAVPDNWELQALREFTERATRGDDVSTLEKGEIVGTGNTRSYRYIKALPTQALCLACHGPREQISPDVLAMLDSLYPADQATGYSINQIRGGITITRPLATPAADTP